MLHFGKPAATVFLADALPADPVIPEAQLSASRILPLAFDISLNIKFPLTVAATYATVVLYLGSVNGQFANRPWPISQTKLFRAFVLLHSTILTLYSAWTFYTMVHIFWTMWPEKHDAFYTSRITDTLCRGRSFPTIGAQKLDSYEAQVGFVGWLFYLSKVYELVDTGIILAKGRTPSRLHVYHHTGVILCGWAMIRFACPPGLLVVLFNSGVHTLMYTYYTLTALRVAVPKAAKAVLTSIQIAQFVVGFALGFVYMFVQYDVPVHEERCYEAMAASSNSSSVSLPTDNFQLDSYHCATIRSHCIRRSSEASVIWVGLIFLAPLTWMFVRFFRQTYIQLKRKTLSDTSVSKAVRQGIVG